MLVTWLLAFTASWILVKAQQSQGSYNQPTRKLTIQSYIIAEHIIVLKFDYKSSNVFVMS